MEVIVNEEISINFLVDNKAQLPEQDVSRDIHELKCL
jgi:hypothetical protein